MNKPWLSQYPAGVPAEIDLTAYPSLLELIDEGVARHAQKTAYVYMGRRYSFAQLDEIALQVPQTRLLKLSDCGHSPQRDQPEAVAQAIEAFVSQL